MPKLILRNRATKKPVYIDSAEWEKLKPNWKHVFEEVGTIETPAEILVLLQPKGPYVDGKLQYK